MTRSLSEIAYDITMAWKQPEPRCSRALFFLSQIDREVESIDGVKGAEWIRLFLSHAANWRGADAERLKAELRSRLDRYDKRVQRQLELQR